MYTSPFDVHRFPDAPVMPDPDGISTEAVKVLHRLRGTLPDPVDWNAADPVEMSTALARAIFDHEAARLTLDLPDDRLEMPVALHQDDPRLLQLLDTARHIRSRDPDEWPVLMDTALEAVQAETAQVMQLDIDGLQARDLDNQNMPLYETIHEDMLDHRLETRYQGILNSVTLASPLATPWLPPLPGTYRGVLPVRPSPMPEAPDIRPEFPVSSEPSRSQPQPTERSVVIPDYQIREITNPETQQVSYRTELNQVSQNLHGGARIWGMNAENDTLPLRAFTSLEAAQAQIDALQSMETLREALRNHEPVTIAGVPYDPVPDESGIDGISGFRVRDGDRTSMPLISLWELQQYAHTGTLTPELAVQQLQNAERSGYTFTPFEESALQVFARDANVDPRFTAYREQEEEYLVMRGGSRSSARNFSLDDLPRIVRDHVQAHRFDHLQNEAPASARTTETGLHLQDLYLPDVHRQPMRIDAAFRETDFIRAFHNRSDALAFMQWINDQKEPRAALDRNEPLTLGTLRYVPAGVPGEYRAVNAETGQAIDRQIIDRQTLHDLLYDGVLREDLARQWQAQLNQSNPVTEMDPVTGMNPVTGVDSVTEPNPVTGIDPYMRTLIRHQQQGLYDYPRITEEISRYAPNGIVDPSRMRTPESTVTPANPVLVPTAAEQQAAAEQLAAVKQQAATSQDMEYRDEINRPAATGQAKEWAPLINQATPVGQEKTQEVQQKGQEVQQKGQEAQQKNQKEQEENQTANDGKNQKGQGQGQGQSKNDSQQAEKPGGFSLFSRVHQHHHYQEPLAGAQPPAEGQSPAGAQPPAVRSTASVSEQDTLGVMGMMDQAPVTPEEIHALDHRVKQEGLTPEIRDGIQNLSERGQRDVKNQKLTPEQLQKNAHALNQLSDTINSQPDSSLKQSTLEYIQKLGQMLMEALKRIFHMGRSSSGPSM